MSAWLARSSIVLALALTPASLGGVLLVGCSGEAEPSGVPEDLQADARVLANQLLEDPARLPLEEVDEAIRDERPVLAADLIAQGARPATERQIELLRALRMTSAEGRRLRSRAVRLHRQRLEALDALGTALSRGIGQEDEQLVAAMHTDAEVQVGIVTLQDELAHIVPELEDRPPLEERGAPPRLPSRDGVVDDMAGSERPEDPNPGAAEPIGPPEPE